MSIVNVLWMLIVGETNKYAIQGNLNKPLDVRVSELEQWLGIILCMKITNLPDCIGASHLEFI
jgi:hypothetical protein